MKIPMTSPVKTTLASLLLCVESGVAIAVVIHAAVKYGRSDAKSHQLYFRRDPLLGPGEKPHAVR